MYLPVIMTERFGWPGFIAFAAPNVVGCVAFGYVVKNRVRSEAMVARHSHAMTWFSVVTVAYHMFFIVWLFDGLLVIPHELLILPLVAAMIVLGLGCVFSFLPDRDWLGLALVTYGLSLAAFLSLDFEPLKTIPWEGRQSGASLGWLAPTMVFGFGLCPYLDLTFHRAMQRSPSRHVFALFGAAFFIMLLLTCMIWFWPGHQRRWLPAMAVTHLLAQCTFTVGAHLREIRSSSALKDNVRRGLILLAPLLIAVLVWMARLSCDSTDLGEDFYVRFLVFYSLVFPGYVLLFMVRSPREARIKRWNLWVFALLVIVSLPAYEFGFIHGRTWLLMLPLFGFGAVAWISHRNRRSGAETHAVP